MAQLSLRDILHPDMGDSESGEEAEALAQNAAPGQEAGSSKRPVKMSIIIDELLE